MSRVKAADTIEWRGAYLVLEVLLAMEPIVPPAIQPFIPSMLTSNRIGAIIALGPKLRFVFQLRSSP
jgi:hypothetical protein